MSIPFYYSIPFLCIFLIMVGAILLSVIQNGRFSWHVSFWTAVITALASAVFLLCVLRDDAAFSYTMGKFPAPFGNEIRGGPLQGLMGFFFSLVMATSMLGGRRDFFADVDGKKIVEGAFVILPCRNRNLAFGSIGNGFAYPLNGSLGEIWVYDRVLSAPEVAEKYLKLRESQE